MNTLNNNAAYILCGRKEKRGNGFIQTFEAFENESTGEYGIERAMYVNGKVVDFSQSLNLSKEQAQNLWNMYIN